MRSNAMQGNIHTLTIDGAAVHLYLPPQTEWSDPLPCLYIAGQEQPAQSKQQLLQIMQILERWYGVDITLSNVDTLKSYWFTIKTESLTELLEMINKISPIEYKLNGKEVTIRYK